MVNKNKKIKTVKNHFEHSIKEEIQDFLIRLKLLIYHTNENIVDLHLNKQYIVAHVIVKFWMNMSFLILEIHAFNIIVYVSDKISFMFGDHTRRFNLFT